MLKNYLKIAFRGLLRRKLHTSINLIGLTIGFICFITISAWIRDELSFDKSLINRDRIYQVIIHHPSGIEDPNVPYILPVLMANELPEISLYTRIERISNVLNCNFKYKNKDNTILSFNENNVCKVDTSFFSIFTYPFIYGDRETALAESNSIVLRREQAIKYFGKTNPVGQVLTFNNDQSFIVSGVFEHPEKSHLRTDFIIPIQTAAMNNWNWRDPSYLLLGENTNFSAFRDKIKNFFNVRQPYNFSDSYEVDILPISKSHLNFGRMRYIFIMTVIAVFIVFIAVINYINLTQANLSSRTAEMGIRKVAGANRSQLMLQLILESLILSLLSMFLAIMLVEMMLPFVNRLLVRDLRIGYMDNPFIILFLIAISLMTGYLAGLYPSYHITSFSPAQSLRSKSFLSRIRIVTLNGQYVISIILMIATFTIYKQLAFINNSSTGINTDQVIELPFNEEIGAKFMVFREELSKNKHILNVTAGQAIPFNEDYKTNSIDWPGKDSEKPPLWRYSITLNDYVETFDIEVLAGRSFSKNFISDISYFMINEEAVKELGLEDPIGQKITFLDQEGEIIGVFKNFHHVSFHKKIMPHIFTIHPRHFRNLRHTFIKISPENTSETIDFIRTKTLELAPSYPFEYHFVDESIDSLYLSEQKLAKVISFFTLVALLISGLGIFGMTSFTAEKKIKEISIRKINGASIFDILIMLNKKIVKWILIAAAIAGPVGFLISFLWLQNFAYKTDLSWWLLPMAMLFSLIISLFMSSFETVKAARQNPAHNLRYE